MKLRHIIDRRKLLWKFIVVGSEARKLELEWQELQQKRNNLESAGQHEKEEFFRMKGFCEGVEWCLKRFS